MMDWLQKFPEDWHKNKTIVENTEQNQKIIAKNEKIELLCQKLTEFLKLELFYLDPIRFLNILKYFY